jgi:hypothetical protein
MNHPRRTHLRLLVFAVLHGAAATTFIVAAVSLLAGGGRTSAAGTALIGAGFAIRAWNLSRLADRNRIGAESEERVARELRALEKEGWTVQHGVTWPKGGDIDHCLKAPNGLVVALETKTRRYTDRHVERTLRASRWLAARPGRRRRSLAVLVLVAGDRGTWRIENDVLIVSLDRLLSALRSHGTADPPRRSRDIVAA